MILENNFDRNSKYIICFFYHTRVRQNQFNLRTTSTTGAKYFSVIT